MSGRGKKLTSLTLSSAVSNSIYPFGDSYLLNVVFLMQCLPAYLILGESTAFLAIGLMIPSFLLKFKKSHWLDPEFEGFKLPGWKTACKWIMSGLITAVGNFLYFLSLQKVSPVVVVVVTMLTMTIPYVYDLLRKRISSHEIFLPVGVSLVVAFAAKATFNISWQVVLMLVVRDLLAIFADYVENVQGHDKVNMYVYRQFGVLIGSTVIAIALLKNGTYENLGAGFVKLFGGLLPFPVLLIVMLTSQLSIVWKNRAKEIAGGRIAQILTIWQAQIIFAGILGLLLYRLFPLLYVPPEFSLVEIAVGILVCHTVFITLKPTFRLK